MSESDDINSFSLLEISLRSTPLSTTPTSTQQQTQQTLANNNIDKKFLYLFTKELRVFQERHFGRNASNTNINKENGLRRWSMMPRIPESIFRDRVRKGPLYIALLSALEYKKQMVLVKQQQQSQSTILKPNISYSWINELAQVNKLNDHTRMFQKMYKDLYNHGYIPSYRFYFDKSINNDNVAGNELSKLINIALQFGGTIVQHPLEATHIVALDPEIDSAEERAKEVDYNKNSNDQDDPERLYLRTLSISEDKTKALVHWWFWPNSADEWIDSNDVNGVINEDDNDVDRAENGAFVVSCRFLRDVARFNEWGIEIDYAIMDFEKCIDADIKAVKSNQLKNTTATAGNDTKEAQNNLHSSTTPNIGSLLRRRRNFSKKAMTPRLIQYQNINKTEQSQSKLVLDGALQISSAASDYRLKHQQQQQQQQGTNTSTVETSTVTASATTTPLVPPSQDDRLNSIIVTELSGQTTLQITQQQQPTQPQGTNNTIAMNRTIKKPIGTTTITPNHTSSTTPDTITSNSSNNADASPSWYDQTKSSSIEKALLPEWFNSSSPHRTSRTYIKTRNTMMHYIKHNINKSTFTQVRHSIPGDIGSLHRMYQFLIHYQLVPLNIGESMPTLSSIRATTTSNTSNIIAAEDDNGMIVPSHDTQQRLLLTKSESINSKDDTLKTNDINDESKKQINNKKQKLDCGNSNNLLLISNQQSLQEQADIHTLTLEILNQRLSKLENRLNMLNDVEDFCDVERISLELERRDLFTERCRYWFGH